MQDIITVSTSKRQEIIDITRQVSSIVKKSKIKQGVCNVYAMHTTASIIINENADQNICLDIIDALDKMVQKGVWRHDKLDGNADAHIKAAILGPSKTMPIKDNRLLLGNWQSVFLFELNGPKKRSIEVSVIGD